MNYQLIIFVFIIQMFGLNSINSDEIMNKTKNYIDQGKKMIFNKNNSISSDEIWNKTKNYINQGKIILNINKTHFIFDELNYTKLDINSTKMLYIKGKKKFIKNII